MDGILYIIATRTATSMFATSTGMAVSGTGTTTGSTMTRTTTTPLLLRANYFISLLIYCQESFVL